jgi:hypothetical protein
VSSERAVKTRTYEEIYEDIANTKLERDDSRPFAEVYAEHVERMRELWDEVARLAHQDRRVPLALALAPCLLRDRYAAEARNARRGQF